MDDLPRTLLSWINQSQSQRLQQVLRAYPKNVPHLSAFYIIFSFALNIYVGFSRLHPNQTILLEPNVSFHSVHVRERKWQTPWDYK